MKALFEHNGFTRMEDIPVKEGASPPSYYHLPVAPPFKINQTVEATPFQSSVKIWKFDIHGIEYIDGEQVAVYRYESER